MELQPHTEEYYFGEITQLFSTQLILPSKPALRTAEAAINTAFDPALEKTLLTVGSLLGDCFETFGISAENAEESALVQRTLGWRFISRKLEHLIVICEQDDNYIYCCDARDNIYVYSAWEDTIGDLHQTFLPFLVSEGKFGCSLLLTVMEYRGNN